MCSKDIITYTGIKNRWILKFSYLILRHGEIMIRDFGSGMTIDELIDMRAVDIYTLKLPSENAFRFIRKASAAMVEAGLPNAVLKELWGDGHSVWLNLATDRPVVVTPSGQIRHAMKGGD